MKADRATIIAHMDPKRGLVVDDRYFFIGRRVFNERAWTEMGARLAVTR